VLLKNNVVIKKKVHEDDRKAVKTPLLIDYTKQNDWMLPIGLEQSERPQSENNFWSSMSGNCKVICL